MEWISRLNEAVDYIEANLEKEISYDKAAHIACCSTFHFQRMFSYIADVPLSEYIRRRRITLAAFDLQCGSEKIIDIALKYGYDSPTSFNRAFHNVHGVSPTEARTKGVALKAYPRISFKITIKGDAEMNYKILTMEAFRIVGIKEHYNMSVEECFEKVPQFWGKTVQSGIVPEILKLMDKEPYGLLGVSTCMNGQDFDYYIAAATDQETPEGMVEYDVPKCTWAIFECVGAMPTAIQELQKRIITEWLPTSGYEYANAPDIEVYFEGDQQAEDYKCEVWLPITKKS
ncbi:MAG TPA: AraC family transcriptional regulator [Syntrophomonadaceae bacterium]|nr:AraC family transcriptional regulator [Syntrophomonadaceae bacterium]HNX28928.1 AraC family transcriptional regulator [Syntrophomonadaceae bacterium]HPR93924.1 AraC family transcriptional regulator [Syntrophomonadaceae bacterium]